MTTSSWSRPSSPSPSSSSQPWWTCLTNCSASELEDWQRLPPRTVHFQNPVKTPKKRQSEFDFSGIRPKSSQSYRIHRSRNGKNNECNWVCLRKSREIVEGKRVWGVVQIPFTGRNSFTYVRKNVKTHWHSLQPIIQKKRRKKLLGLISGSRIPRDVNQLGKRPTRERNAFILWIITTNQPGKSLMMDLFLSKKMQQDALVTSSHSNKSRVHHNADLPRWEAQQTWACKLYPNAE